MAGLVRQYLGNYRLSYLLGYGGFAEVYLGEHITLKTLAAIKVLRMQLEREAQISFLHEARIIAGLDHPHIVHVLEFGVDHHTPYLVMSYAPNGTLRQRYPRGTMLPSANILPYIKQTAAALQYAHDRDLVHRDVKPENLLLGPGDNVLLSDFGLAMVSQSADHSGFQKIAGTMAYMAPEQLWGRPGPASDQYALGIVVYEWLTGGWPFNGTDQEIALQHVQSPPPLLSQKVAAIPFAIKGVVLKALAKNPSERFPTVQDFARAFEEACILEPRTQVISIQPQILPAIADASDAWQVDTPDSVVFIPESGLRSI
jgi:serine/threonine protein kinase